MSEHELDLFIIHSFGYRDDYRNLLSLLTEDKQFHYINHSTTPEKNVVASGGMISDEELAAKLFDRIKDSGLILIIAGDYVSTSKWIQFEITTAAKLNKPMIAIVPAGIKRVSPIVTAYANKIISWDRQTLLSCLHSLEHFPQAKALA